MTSNAPIPPEQWIPIEEVHYRRVAPGYLKLVVLTTLLLGLIPLTALMGVLMLVVALALPWLLLAGLLLMAILCAAVILSHLGAQRLGYAVRQRDLVVKRGILWRRHTCLPLSRLQHVTLSQGPLERLYGLCTLKGYTAGSPQAEITIPGLPAVLGEQLRQNLMNRAGARHEQ